MFADQEVTVITDPNRLEHFIPLRVPVLLNYLLTGFSLSDAEQARIKEINQMFCERFHLKYLKLLLVLLNDFAPFDPDADTLKELTLSKKEKNEKGAQLMKGLAELAERCNFIKFSNEEFNEYLKLQPDKGLAVKVFLDDFRSFQVFYRGEQEAYIDWPWWYFWKKIKRIRTRQYSRIFLAAQLKIEEDEEDAESVGTAKKTKTVKTSEAAHADETKKKKNKKNGNVIIKLFKDITRENLKIVAPEARVIMPIFDRFKIGGTAGVGVFPFVVKLFTAALNWWIFIVFAFGCCTAVVKAVFSFFNSKNKYLQIYASSLYYKNLSNNSGAITTMMEMTERQEILETLLGWFFLYINRETPLTEKELDLKVEHWLKDYLGLSVDFEVDDALRKLEDQKIAIRHQEGEGDAVRYSVLSPLETLRQLDKDWDAYHDFSKEDQDFSEGSSDF